MLNCAEMLLWSHCDVVPIESRWMSHGSKSNDEIISDREFVRHWFRLRGATVGDSADEITQKQVVGRFFK